MKKNQDLSFSLLVEWFISTNDIMCSLSSFGQYIHGVVHANLKYTLSNWKKPLWKYKNTTKWLSRDRIHDLSAIQNLRNEKLNRPNTRLPLINPCKNNISLYCFQLAPKAIQLKAMNSYHLRLEKSQIWE